MTQTRVPMPAEYGPGPVAAAAAFSADIGLPPSMSAQQLVRTNQRGLPIMSVRPGMVLKYVPYRPASTAEGTSTGGRYLFDTYTHALEYRDFLESLVLRGEDTRFWDRPFFTEPTRLVWHVAGAHNFTGIDEHHVIRFERRALRTTRQLDNLSRTWARILERAAERSLAAAHLLLDETQSAVGLFTAERRPEFDLRSIDNYIEYTMEDTSSLLDAEDLGDTEILLDRTSVSALIWSPVLRAAGGPNAIYPIGELATAAAPRATARLGE
jgi:hypothetical protein